MATIGWSVRFQILCSFLYHISEAHFPFFKFIYINPAFLGNGYLFGLEPVLELTIMPAVFLVRAALVVINVDMAPQGDVM